MLNLISWILLSCQGRGGWDDSRHVDTAWVSVHLKDVNDNPPQFSRTHAHVKVREDAALGTLLASIPAHDPDMVRRHGRERWYGAERNKKLLL